MFPSAFWGDASVIPTNHRDEICRMNHPSSKLADEKDDRRWQKFIFIELKSGEENWLFENRRNRKHKTPSWEEPFFWKNGSNQFWGRNSSNPKMTPWHRWNVCKWFLSPLGFSGFSQTPDESHFHPLQPSLQVPKSLATMVANPRHSLSVEGGSPRKITIGLRFPSFLGCVSCGHPPKTRPGNGFQRHNTFYWYWKNYKLLSLFCLTTYVFEKKKL